MLLDPNSHLLLYKDPYMMLFLDIIIPTDASLRWRRMKSFWDGIIVLFIKTKNKQAEILMSLLSMRSHDSIHMWVVL